MYTWLSEALSNGGVVISASRRLSRELRRACDQRQQEAGHTAWPTPDIRFFNDWLGELLESSADAEQLPVRIGNQAATVLWERCLSPVFQTSLPGFGSVVRQCLDASARLQAWQVPSQELNDRAAGPEQRQFAAGAEAYSSLLARHNWTDDAGLAKTVIGLLESAKIVSEPRLTFAGFDQVWPALASLFDALRESGVQIAQPDSRESASEIGVTSFADKDAEYRAAGAWARKQLAENPQQRLAIISPELKSNAPKILRLVREGYAPAWQYAEPSYKNSVNASYGRPLIDYPAIGIALMLLRWVQEGLSSPEVSVLLRSPAIETDTLAGRCRLEISLRRLPDRSWRAADLLAVLQHPDTDLDALRWRECMQNLVDASSRFSGKDSPAEWAERFDQLLGDAGWPGSGPQDSNDYQLVNRWRDLLNELARLEPVLPALTFREAVSRLNALATETIFQPESESGVLPVMGTLEAAGMEFDQIWISGFDAGQWPARGHPLAFVSRQLQKDLAMPDATPQDTLAFSRRVMERLLNCANSVVVSWSRSDEGVEQQASPLLLERIGHDLPEPESVSDPGWHAAGLLNDERVQAVDEDIVPAVAEDENIKGGAYTVQLQSSDPFSGFAKGRLRVNDLQRFQPGLSASTRGSAIHNALSFLYAEKPSQADLRSWNKVDRTNLIRQSAKRSLAKLSWRADRSLRRIIELEQRRSERILMQFLEVESDRDPFQVVMVEEDLLYSRFGVRLRFRVDRVDRLGDDGLLIIDYKTGAEKTLIDKDGALKDLQLMVYALALPGEVGGMTLINLDSKKISFKGTEKIAEWSASYAEWVTETETVIESLARGDARVNIAQSTDKGRLLNVLSRFTELRRA